MSIDTPVGRAAGSRTRARLAGGLLALFATGAVLGGCGGDEPGAPQPAPPPPASASSAAPSSTSDATAYCNAVREAEARGQQADPNADPQAALDEFSRIAETAPPEIQGDYRLIIEALPRVFEALGQAFENPQSVNTAELERLQADVQAAGERIQAYTKEACGIDFTQLN